MKSTIIPLVAKRTAINSKPQIVGHVRLPPAHNKEFYQKRDIIQRESE